MKLMRNYVKRKEIDETMEQYEQHTTHNKTSVVVCCVVVHRMADEKTERMKGK